MAASSHRAQEPPEARLRRLAAWAGELQGPDFEIGRWQGGDRGPDGTIQMPWFEYSAAVDRFHHELGRDGWLRPFDWPTWIADPEHGALLEDPTRIAGVDEAVLGRLLTTIIRNDRFHDGFLASAFERGVILAIVRRAGVLADQGSTEGPTVTS
jgi:hypothetical protein